MFGGGTCFGDIGGLWAITGTYWKLSEQKVGFSETTDVFTIHRVSLNFVLTSEAGWANGKLFFPGESGDESRTTSKSQKKNF